MKDITWKINKPIKRVEDVGVFIVPDLQEVVVVKEVVVVEGLVVDIDDVVSGVVVVVLVVVVVVVVVKTLSPRVVTGT